METFLKLTREVISTGYSENIIKQEKTSSLKNVDSIRVFVMIQGILAGFGGSVHGISEMLQGNIPTGGFMLNTIGAFTVIQNYLITGIAAVIAGLSLAVCAICFIHRKYGPIVFLILSILLFSVGSGIAQIPFLLITWGVSTRIGKPLIWWRKVLSWKLGIKLAKSWLAIFISGYVFLAGGIGIWVVLLPPVVAHKITIVQYICWTFLGIGLILQIATIPSVFAHDIMKE